MMAKLIAISTASVIDSHPAISIVIVFSVGFQTVQ
jgi:hypothetical protein